MRTREPKTPADLEPTVAGPGGASPPPALGPMEMAPLVVRVREFIESHAGESATVEASGDLAALSGRVGLADRGRGAAEVILSEETAIELGHPSTPSLAFVLTTGRSDLVRHGRVTRIGPDLDGMPPGARVPIAQVVLIAVAPGGALDRFDLENAQYLTRGLPGYMVRSIPGRLWARVSRRALASGFGIETIGTALVAAYAAGFPGIEKVEVVFVTSGAGAIAEIAPVAKEAEILAGRHKKLLLGADGEIDCEDLDCERCDEKPACDNLRDIVIRRREGRRHG